MNIKDIPIGSVCIFDAVSGRTRVKNRLGIRVEDGFGVEGVSRRFWADEEWNITVKRVLAPSIEALARCAVIDPDDEGQVEDHWRMAGQTLTSYHKALRAMAMVTKPDEPQGLGAVVLVPDTGQRWVRADGSDVSWWNAGGDWCHWGEFPATVQVLSEGLLV